MIGAWSTWILAASTPSRAASGDDRDLDGVLNHDDACRKEPETPNGFRDGDGCPDHVPRIRFVPLHQGQPHPEVVLLVQSSTSGDQWVSGSFEAESLPGEVWNVQARAGSCLSGTLRTVSGEVDRILEIPLVMNEVASVVVDPVGPDGGWQAGVVARYENADPLCPSATFPVERDGAHKLAAGTYTVHLTAPGGAPHRWAIDLAEGRELRLRAQFGLPQRVIVEARDARLWVPYPVSAWIRADDPAVAELAPGTEVRVEAPGFRPATVVLNGETPVDLAPSGPTGGRSTLVVRASPSDDVAVDGHAVPLDAGGSVILPIEAGRHEIVFRGGGRLETVVSELRPAKVVYVRDRPSPHRILYPRDRAIPDGAGFALLDRLARERGRYRYRVVAFLPREGKPDYDAELAHQRAQVVFEALLASGVPADHLEVGPLHEPYPGSPEEQRRVEIHPVPL